MPGQPGSAVKSAFFSHIWDLSAGLAMTAAIFAFDVMTPRGTLTSALYIFPLLFVLRLKIRLLYPVFPAYLTLLTSIGAFFKPDIGVAVGAVIFNRVLGITIFWVLSFLNYRINVSDEALIAREELYRGLSESSPDVIARFDRALRVTYYNKAGALFFGLDEKPAGNKNIFEYDFDPGLTEKFAESLRAVFEESREKEMEFEFFMPGGARYFHSRIVPEFAKTGEVASVMAFARDITERKRAEDRLRYIGFHDEVTGLYNRAFFEEEIQRIDNSRELPVSVVMGDLNFLKLANDAFGHEEGDRLLRSTADLLRSACRESDIIARWGGDEFAVIFPKTDSATALGLCERIHSAFKGHDGTVIHPSISIGIATKDYEWQNVYQMLRDAEIGMYEDKLNSHKINENNLIATMLDAIKEKAGSLDAHIGRCVSFGGKFAAELGLGESETADLIALIKLHDIGGVIIPRALFAKKTPLSSGDWDVIKKHSEVGFRIAKVFPDTSRIAEEILSHGERWDGKGYPRGLKENDIPYLVRIFALIDAYDVMTHARPYAKLLSRQEAEEEIRQNAGKQFDPGLAARFIGMLNKPALRQ